MSKQITHAQIPNRHPLAHILGTAALNFTRPYFTTPSLKFSAVVYPNPLLSALYHVAYQLHSQTNTSRVITLYRGTIRAPRQSI